MWRQSAQSTGLGATQLLVRIRVLSQWPLGRNHAACCPLTTCDWKNKAVLSSYNWWLKTQSSAVLLQLVTEKTKQCCPLTTGDWKQKQSSAVLLQLVTEKNKAVLSSYNWWLKTQSSAVLLQLVTENTKQCCPLTNGDPKTKQCCSLTNGNYRQTKQARKKGEKIVLLRLVTYNRWKKERKKERKKKKKKRRTKKKKKKK